MLSKNSKKYIAIGLLFHLLAVIFSTGYFNHDEQREVLQLVGYKLGNYDVSYLSIQFTSALRSWFHPGIYLFVSKVLMLFSPFNPFTHAFYYRLVSSLLGVVGLCALYKSFEEEINERGMQEIFFLLTSVIWFFPFLQARTANENVCSSFFLMGLYFLKKSTKLKGAFIAGFLFGLSFVSRFQMGFMVAPTVFWFVIFQKYDWKKFVVLALGVLSVVGLNFVLDSSLYGYATFTPFNYFYVNIMKGYAASFGVTPWYQYVIYAIKDGIPPLSVVYTLMFFILWIRFPKSLVTWMTLPFVVVHSLIGHKELRFIFPILYFLPLIGIMLIDRFKINLSGIWFKIFIGLNIPFLIFVSTTPASNLMKYYQHIYNKSDVVNKIYVSSPFEDYTKFYLKNDIKYVLYTPLEISNLVVSDKKVYFFAMSLKERELILDYPQCKKDFSLFPEWLYQLDFIKKRRTFRSWTLVECSN